MNHIYPNSLHVTGAIMRARSTGELPQLDAGRPEAYRLRAPGPERDAMEKRAFENSLDALYALGVAIDERGGEARRTGISLVVLDTMLWTRYSSDYFDVRQGLHVNGPLAGDVVLVTDKPVIESIQAGLITLDRAIELGVIRVYAREHDVQGLLAQLGDIGETPLPHSRPGANPFDSSASDWGVTDPLRTRNRAEDGRDGP